jgi:hypothetical protein
VDVVEGSGGDDKDGEEYFGVLVPWKVPWP